MANGFNEAEVLLSMRALAETGATLHLVAPETGLVQGWSGQGFGHSHAVDVPLANALAADYSLMLVPSGGRAMDKLKTNAHTARFIKGFMSYGNPAAFLGDAVQILAHLGVASGRTVTGPATQEAALVAAGATWVTGPSPHVDGQILTACIDGPEGIKAVMSAVVAHFVNIPAEMRLAA